MRGLQTGPTPARLPPPEGSKGVGAARNGTVWVVARGLRIVLAVILAGLVAGVAGGLLSLLNVGIETLAMGHRYFDDPAGVSFVPLWRRTGVPVIGGLVAGIIWWWLRRHGRLVSVNQAVHPDQPKRLSPGIVVDAVAQLIVVGSGISLGRETAPRQVAGFLGQTVSERFGLGAEGRRTVIATASAAGLAAVYNVPVAGALYAVELILRPNLRTRKGWLEVLAATVVSGLATVTAWLFNHNRPIYRLPARALAMPPVWWLAVVAVVALAGGGVFSRSNDAAKAHAPLPARLWWAVPLGSALVAVIALTVPQVPGNGQIMVQAALTPPVLLGGVLLMALGKGLATHIALRVGASGGLLTPSLAIGACLGAATGILSGHRTTAEITVLAVVGAACLLAATQRAPLFAAAFALELVKAPPVLIGAVAVAVALTWLAHLGVIRCWARWRARTS